MERNPKQARPLAAFYANEAARRFSSTLPPVESGLHEQRTGGDTVQMPDHASKIKKKTLVKRPADETFCFPAEP